MILTMLSECFSPLIEQRHRFRVLCSLYIQYTSDIVMGAAGRGRIEYCARGYAVIARSMECTCNFLNSFSHTIEIDLIDQIGGLNLLDIYGTAKDYGKQMAFVDALNSLIAAASRIVRLDGAIKRERKIYCYSQ